MGCAARRSGCAYSLGRTEGGQLFVLQVCRRQSCTLLIVGENSGNACYVRIGGVDSGGHVICLLSLPVTVVMSCFYFRCQ